MSTGRIEYAEIEPRKLGQKKAEPPEPKHKAVIYSCSVGGKTVNSHAFLPASSELQPTISDVVLSQVHAHARAEAGAPPSTAVQCSHIRPMAEAPAPEATSSWLSRRMAPNCAPHYNPSEVTSWNNFTCRYIGTGKVADPSDSTGKRKVSAQNPFKVYKGTLPSCDRYGADGSTGMEISNEVMRAVQELAYESAGGKEAELDVTQFVCDVQSLPMY